MRRPRIVGVIALGLAVMVRGDIGQHAPVVVQKAVVVIPPDITTTFWYQFWYADRGGLRMSLSEPAGARVSEAFAKVEVQARMSGFKFRTPAVRQTTREAEMRMDERLDYILAVTYYGVDLIVMNSWWVDRLSDDELCALAAHELGHNIDRQNQRFGHPLLVQMPPDGADEFVADAIAGNICGWDAIVMLNMHIKVSTH